MALKIKAGKYTGTGSAQSITGLGFALNSGAHTMLIIKGGSNVAQVGTSEMGSTKMQDITGATPATGKLSSYDADGFTLGTDATVNANGTVYYYLAITDTTGGSFRTGTYAGNATGPRAITGLGFSPNGLFIWDDLGDTGGYRTSDMPTDSYLPWGTNSGLLTDRILSLDADGFTLSFRNETNGTGRNYYWAAFVASANLIKNLSYTGNGSAGHGITGMGFQSDFVVTKDGSTITANAAALASSQESAGNALLVTASAEATGIISSLDTDGFTTGTSVNANTNADTYYSFGFKNSTNAVAAQSIIGNMLPGQTWVRRFAKAERHPYSLMGFLNQTQQTITGLSRITITTAQTQPGKSRITATSSQTITGKARITAVTTQTQTGLARITQTSLQTISGVARVIFPNQAIYIANPGQTWIRRFAKMERHPYSLTGFLNQTRQTILGLARITATTVQTLTGVARITGTTSQTITGKSRITASTAQTLTGKARITATTAQTLTGKARITATSLQTQTGISRITQTTTQTISGVARIAGILPGIVAGNIQPGRTWLRHFANAVLHPYLLMGVLNQTRQLMLGLARITIATVQTITGKARITVTTSQALTGKARITASSPQTITGKSRITNTTAQTQTGKARITAIATQVLTGKSRITATTPRTLPGKSRILALSSRLQTGLASISRKIPVTIQGKASIASHSAPGIDTNVIFEKQNVSATFENQNIAVAFETQNVTIVLE